MIKKFSTYIKEDYSANYQINMFEPTILSIAEQFIHHYATTPCSLFTRINTYEKATKFISFLDKTDLEDLYKDFIRLTNSFLLPRQLSAFTEKTESELMVYINLLNRETLKPYFEKYNISILAYAKYMASKTTSYEELKSFLAENKKSLKVYRSLMLPTHQQLLAANTSDHKEGIGKYWTYDISTALAYDAGKKEYDRVTVLLEADVNYSDVNWSKTVMKSIYHLADEKEIELYPEATVEVKNILIPTENFLKIAFPDYKTKIGRLGYPEKYRYVAQKYDLVNPYRTKDIAGTYIRLKLTTPEYVKIGVNTNRTYDK